MADPASPGSDSDARPRAADPNALLDLMPLTRTLGATFSRYDKDEVRARLDWAPGLCTVNGLLHGGAVMALADSTGGACAFLNLPAPSQGTTTVESKTNFLGAVREGYIEAVSRPLHVGRTVIVVETDVRDQRDRLVARVTQTQLVLT
jgi:1,4-dihydroxy-2-naphthoyl-CoA hydrolase